MSAFLEDFLQFDFLQRAFFSVFLSSIATGLVGSYVTLERMTYMTGAISHCTMAGLGGALFLSYKLGSLTLPPLLGALFVALMAAVIIFIFTHYFQERLDTALSALWAVGMALGIFLVHLTPGSQKNLLGYLFGNILLISPLSLILTGLIDLILILLFGLFYNKIFAVMFDKEFAVLQGVPVKLFRLCSLLLASIVLVLLLRLVGIILSVAMLTLPAATAGRFTKTLWKMCLLAIMLTFVTSTGGLIISYSLNLSPGATMTLVTGGLYLVALGVSQLIGQR